MDLTYQRVVVHVEAHQALELEAGDLPKVQVHMEQVRFLTPWYSVQGVGDHARCARQEWQSPLSFWKTNRALRSVSNLQIVVEIGAWTEHVVEIDALHEHAWLMELFDVESAHKEGLS